MELIAREEELYSLPQDSAEELDLKRLIEDATPNDEVGDNDKEEKQKKQILLQQKK